jgi:hypothetical protein
LPILAKNSVKIKAKSSGDEELAKGKINPKIKIISEFSTLLNKNIC